MNGFIVGPVKIQLGSTEYCGDLHVAQLRDPMLLGMEFLQQRKVRLDLENGLVISDLDTVPHAFWTNRRTSGGSSSYSSVASR
jgi:hypothetical protein